MKKKGILRITLICMLILFSACCFVSCDKAGNETGEENNQQQDNLLYTSVEYGSLFISNSTVTWIYSENGSTVSFRGQFIGETILIATMQYRNDIMLASPRTFYFLLDGKSFSVLTDEEKQVYEKQENECKHTRLGDIVGQEKATCTKDGYTGDRYCLDCQEIVVQGKTIPATGHTYTEPSESICCQAICTQAETRYYACAVCGEIATEEKYSYEVQGTVGNHSFVEPSGIVKTQATCVKDRVEYASCEVCHIVNYDVTVSVAETATGNHNFNKPSNSIYLQADCSRNEIRFYSCEMCGMSSTDPTDTYEVVGTIKNQHDFSKASGRVYQAENCVTNRVEYAECACCGALTDRYFVEVQGTATGKHAFTELSDIVYQKETCSSDRYNYYRCEMCGLINYEKVGRVFNTEQAHVYQNHVCTVCRSPETNSTESWDVSRNENTDAVKVYLYARGGEYDMLVYGEEGKGGETVSFASDANVYWKAYNEKITKIYVGTTITSIGDYFFSNLIELTTLCAIDKSETAKSVVLPKGVESIGNFTFLSCGKIGRVQTEDNSGLIKIGVGAFSKCASLAEVTFENVSSLTTVHKNAFHDDTSLLSANLSGTGIIKINQGVFENCESLSTVSLPSSVDFLGAYSFFGTALSSFVFPSSLRNVGTSAFENCDRVTSVDFSGTDLVSIGENAFKNCTLLNTFTLCDTLCDIGEGCFEGTKYYRDENNWTNGVLYLGDIHNAKRILLKVSGLTGKLVIDDNTVVIASGACKNCISITDVQIGDNVKVIGKEAFRSCIGLVNIDFGANVKEILPSAFYQCALLTKVVLPESMETVGDEAFAYCTQLRSFGYYGRLSMEVGQNGLPSFFNEVNLFEVYTPSVLSPTFNAFVSYDNTKAMKKIVIDYDNREIDLWSGERIIYFDENRIAYRDAEKKYEDIEVSLDLDNDIVTINEIDYVIGDAQNDINVDYENYVITFRTVDSQLFFDAEGKVFRDEEHNFEDLSAKVFFDDNSEITSVYTKGQLYGVKFGYYYPTSVVTKGLFNFAVYEETAYLIGMLKNSDVNLSLPTSFVFGTKKIEEYEIFSYAFYNNTYYPQISSVIIPDAVTGIGEKAFYNCYTLEKIQATSSIERVGKNAFYGTKYYNTLSNWKSSALYLTVQDMATEAKVNLLLCVVPGQNAELTRLQIIDNTVLIADEALSECKDLKTLDMCSTVQYVGKNLLTYCTSITDITISVVGQSKEKNSFIGYFFGGESYLDNNECLPSSLKTITVAYMDSVPRYAFYGCEKIKKFVLAEGVTQIGKGAFNGCSNAVFDITSPLTKIEERAFYYCTNLTKVSFSMSLPSIGRFAFYHSGLYTFEIPGSTTAIGEYAFADSYMLYNVKIGNSITSIGECAFQNCIGLVGITLGEGFVPNEGKFDEVGKTIMLNGNQYEYVESDVDNWVIYGIDIVGNHFVDSDYLVIDDVVYYYNDDTLFFQKNDEDSTKVNENTKVADSSINLADGELLINNVKYYFDTDKRAVFSDSILETQVKNVFFSPEEKAFSVNETIEYHIDENDYICDANNNKISEDFALDGQAGSFSYEESKTKYYFYGTGSVYSDIERKCPIDNFSIDLEGKTITVPVVTTYYFDDDFVVYSDSEKENVDSSCSVDLSTQSFVAGGTTYYYCDKRNVYSDKELTILIIGAYIYSPSDEKEIRTVYLPTEFVYYFSGSVVYSDSISTKVLSGASFDAEGEKFSIYDINYHFEEDGSVYFNNTSTLVEGAKVSKKLVRNELVTFYYDSLGKVYFDEGKQKVYAEGSITETNNTIVTEMGSYKYKSGQIYDINNVLVEGSSLNTTLKTFRLPIDVTYYYTPNGKVYSSPLLSEESLVDKTLVDLDNRTYSVYNSRWTAQSDGKLADEDNAVCEDAGTNFLLTKKMEIKVQNIYFYQNNALYDINNQVYSTNFTMNESDSQFSYLGKYYTFDDKGKVYTNGTDVVESMSIDITAKMLVLTEKEILYYTQDGKVYTVSRTNSAGDNLVEEVSVDFSNRKVIVRNMYYYNASGQVSRKKNYFTTSMDDDREYVDISGSTLTHKGKFYTIDADGNTGDDAIFVDRDNSCYYEVVEYYFDDKSNTNLYYDQACQSLVSDMTIGKSEGGFTMKLSGQERVDYYYDASGNVYTSYTEVAGYANAVSDMKVNVSLMQVTYYDVYYYFNNKGEMFTDSQNKIPVSTVYVYPSDGLLYFDNTEMYYNECRLFSAIDKNETSIISGAYINLQSGDIEIDGMGYESDGMSISAQKVHGSVDRFTYEFNLDEQVYYWDRVNNTIALDLECGTIDFERKKAIVFNEEYYIKEGIYMYRTVGSIDTENLLFVLDNKEYTYLTTGEVIYNNEAKGLISTESKIIYMDVPNADRIEYFYFEDGTIKQKVGEVSIGTNTFTIDEREYSYVENGTVYRKSIKKNIGEDCFDNCMKIVEIINNSSLNIVKQTDGFGGIAKNAKVVGKVTTSISNYGDFLFFKNNNEWFLMGYIGTESECSLPSPSYDYTISEHAFAQNSYISQVIFSDRVRSISNYAFRDCTNLVRVTFASNVESVGNYAFAGTSISSLNTSAIRSIGDYAFYQCLQLTNLTFTSLESIGDYAFSECPSIKTLSLGSSIRNIGEYAFSDCVGLTTLIVPSLTVPTIGKCAFSDCGNLSTVTWRADIENLTAESMLFARSGINTQEGIVFNFTGLTKVPSYILYVNEEKKQDSPRIKLITLSSTITEIGEYAFTNLNLTSVSLPESLLVIGDYAFSGTNLVSVTIPDVVSDIGEYAFSDIETLTSIKLSSNITELKTGVLYGCISLKQIVIPSKVKKLCQYSLGKTPSLEKVVILLTVEEVESYVFSKEEEGTYQYKKLIVFYEGNYADWTHLIGLTENGRVTADDSCSRLYYSEDVPAEYPEYYWHFVNGEACAWVSE